MWKSGWILNRIFHIDNKVNPNVAWETFYTNCHGSWLELWKGNVSDLFTFYTYIGFTKLDGRACWRYNGTGIQIYSPPARVWGLQMDIWWGMHPKFMYHTPHYSMLKCFSNLHMHTHIYIAEGVAFIDFTKWPFQVSISSPSIDILTIFVPWSG